MKIKEDVKNWLINSLNIDKVDSELLSIDYPSNPKFGDFSTNIALILSKKLNKNSKALADEIKNKLDNNSDVPSEIEGVDVAGPGFINIKIKDEYFVKGIADLAKQGDSAGKITKDAGRKVMVEYTDPNPFKIFHIGHLMANTVGESLARITEFSGAEVIRACYQGDVGLHVAKTMWAIMKNKSAFPDEKISLVDRLKFLGDMYVLGNEKYETDEDAKKEITEVNKKVFEKSDEEMNVIYKKGRDWSLEYFDTIYKKLGTKFDKFYFESEVAEGGVKIVKEFLAKGIFENSEGAIVFPGEKHGEHTRVFINSQGLPTYEAKELGLTMRKFADFPNLSESIAVTANEQNAYFKVIIAAFRVMYPEISSRMKHLSHGILRPTSGKMSSRKGNVVSAEFLLEEFESLVEEKLKDREFTVDEHDEVRRAVAVAALKFTILRQAIGGDIIYDPTKAVSFEGDSGPYLQYATVRANAVIAKAKELGISDTVGKTPEKVELLEKLLIRFPEVIERARLEYAPHHIVTYLVNLASEFNSYYANNQIVSMTDELSPYRVSLAKVFSQVMKNGLWVLGIKVPERM